MGVSLPGRPRRNEVIQCTACGTENPAGATYCKQCARKLDAAAQAAVAERRASHTATGIRWSAVLAAGVILILILLLIALFVTGIL